MDELLKLLKENALETPENLAKMLGTSEAAVKTQIAKYEADGIIKGYKAIVNEDELELNKVTAVIEVKICPEREGGFNVTANRISKFAEVESLYLMSGTFDLLIFISGKTLNEVASFVSEKLSTMDGVTATATHFMLKTYKQDGVLMHTGEKHERLKVTP